MERDIERKQASFLVEILRKNQATIPPNLQRAIGAQQGDKLEFIVEEGSVVSVRVLKLVPRAILTADILQLIEKRGREMAAQDRDDYTAEQIMEMTGKGEESVNEMRPSPEIERMVAQRGQEMLIARERRDYTVEEIMSEAGVSNFVRVESPPKELLELIARRQSETLAMKDRRDHTPTKIMELAPAESRDADRESRKINPKVSVTEP